MRDVMGYEAEQAEAQSRRDDDYCDIDELTILMYVLDR